MPIEDEALERVQNTAELNIHRGKIAAFKALQTFLQQEKTHLDNVFVPDIPQNDQRLDEVNLMSYNSIRNNWIAMYHSWQYPDIFVTVQYANGSVYTQVSQDVSRFSDHSQATLF